MQPFEKRNMFCEWLRLVVGCLLVTQRIGTYPTIAAADEQSPCEVEFALQAFFNSRKIQSRSAAMLGRRECASG